MGEMPEEALVKPAEEPLERCTQGGGASPGRGVGGSWEEDVVTVSGAPEGPRKLKIGRAHV